MKSLVASLIFSIGALVNGCSTEYVVEPLFECTERLENPYGIVSHISRSGTQYEYELFEDAINSLEDLGVNCIRTDLDCGGITPVGMPTTTERFDKLFSATSHSGLEVCGIITNLKYNLRCWEDYPSYWRYIDTLTARYDKQIAAYEILNEADRFKDDGITSRYNDLLQQTYKRIKSKNPEAVVLYSGISWTKAGFFNLSMKEGAYDFFDIMNFHVYDTPENLLSHFEDVRNNMNKYGWSKHVWMTETGYSTCAHSPVNDIFIATEEEQASRLPKTFLISFACGVDKVFWYNHRSPELSSTQKEYYFGLTHSDFTPKPAYRTFKTLIQMCPSGSSQPVLCITDGLYIARWTTPDRKQAAALWTEESASISVLPNLSDRYYDMEGNKISYQHALKNLKEKQVVYLL